MLAVEIETHRFDPGNPVTRDRRDSGAVEAAREANEELSALMRFHKRSEVAGERRLDLCGELGQAGVRDLFRFPCDPMNVRLRSAVGKFDDRAAGNRPNGAKCKAFLEEPCRA